MSSRCRWRWSYRVPIRRGTRGPYLCNLRSPQFRLHEKDGEHRSVREEAGGNIASLHQAKHRTNNEEVSKSEWVTFNALPSTCTLSLVVVVVTCVVTTTSSEREFDVAARDCGRWPDIATASSDSKGALSLLTFFPRSIALNVSVMKPSVGQLSKDATDVTLNFASGD